MDVLFLVSNFRHCSRLWLLLDYNFLSDNILANVTFETLEVFLRDLDQKIPFFGIKVQVESSLDFIFINSKHIKNSDYMRYYMMLSSSTVAD